MVFSSVAQVDVSSFCDSQKVRNSKSEVLVRLLFPVVRTALVWHQSCVVAASTGELGESEARKAKRTHAMIMMFRTTHSQSRKISRSRMQHQSHLTPTFSTPAP